MPRLASCAKVSPSPLAADKGRKERPAEPLDEALVEPGAPVKPEGEHVSWEDLPGPVLELIFNHLKRAAIAGQRVFLKSPDQQVVLLQFQHRSAPAGGGGGGFLCHLHCAQLGPIMGKKGTWIKGGGNEGRGMVIRQRVQVRSGSEFHLFRLHA